MLDPAVGYDFPCRVPDLDTEPRGGLRLDQGSEQRFLGILQNPSDLVREVDRTATGNLDLGEFLGKSQPPLPVDLPEDFRLSTRHSARSDELDALGDRHWTAVRRADALENVERAQPAEHGSGIERPGLLIAIIQDVAQPIEEFQSLQRLIPLHPGIIGHDKLDGVS